MKYLVLGFLAVFLIIALSACDGNRWLTSFEVGQRGFDSEIMKMVTDNSPLSLPTGTVGLKFSYQPPIDPSFMALLEIPMENREDVFKQIETIKNEERRISSGSPDPSWWPPPKNLTLIDRQCTQTDNSYLRLVLTEKDSNLFLYVRHAVF